MAKGGWRMMARHIARVVAVVLLAALPGSAPLPPWQLYAFHEGSFVLLDPFLLPALSAPSRAPPSPSRLPLPRSWHVTDSVLADVTDDGVPEWVLLVWRPWRDWPIQRWSSAPSPIADFHDEAGDSCHLILLDPRDGREIWAGSALPAPLLALAVGDVDGDGSNEVVTLEGDYAAGREGPATHVDVWRWNGFGFSLRWRSSSGVFRELRLTDADNSGILNIAVR
jgi:hypothetical protein